MKKMEEKQNYKSLIPSFENQSYKQVKDLCVEFGCTWENEWQHRGKYSLTYDVYIYGDKLYTKI